MSNIETGGRIKHGDDEYVIGDELGKGGFGRVFKSERIRPLRSPVPVVVKVPHPDVMKDPILAQKFARKARILANIRHPNVVRIIAYLEFEDGEPLCANVA